MITILLKAACASGTFLCCRIVSMHYFIGQENVVDKFSEVNALLVVAFDGVLQSFPVDSVEL